MVNRDRQRRGTHAARDLNSVVRRSGTIWSAAGRGVKFILRREFPGWNAAVFPRGRMLLLATAFVGCTGLAIALSAEQSDSGWVASHQRPFTVNSHDAGLPDHSVLSHVFQEMESRLPSGARAPGAVTAQQGVMRFAARPDGIDGWRAATQASSPLQGPLHIELQSPQLNPPANPNSATEIVIREEKPVRDAKERDCGENDSDGGGRVSRPSPEAAIDDELELLPTDA
jgi:hypothetical protein